MPWLAHLGWWLRWKRCLVATMISAMSIILLGLIVVVLLIIGIVVASRF